MQTDPAYADRFKHVWLWNEFPYKKDFGGKDTGIDLVALTHNGDYWAIQCKCYQADAYIDKPSIDTFIATSSKEFINYNLETVGFVQRFSLVYRASVEKGAYYSDFYGGLLIESKDLDKVEQQLEDCKTALNLHREVKWSRVTENYLEKYKSLMDVFFEYVQTNQIENHISSICYQCVESIGVQQASWLFFVVLPIHQTCVWA